MLPMNRLLSLSTDLAQLFARGQDEQNNGLSSGFLDGSRHQQLVRGRSPGHRGVLVGVVLNVDVARGVVTVSRSSAPRRVRQRGDGVVFDSKIARGEERSSGAERGHLREAEEQGGALYDVRGGGADEEDDDDDDEPVELTFGRATGTGPDLQKVQPGDPSGAIVITRSSAHYAVPPPARLARQRQRSASPDAASASAAPAAAVRVTVSGSLGNRFACKSSTAREGLARPLRAPLEEARSSPLTAESVKSAACAWRRRPRP